MRRGFVMWLRKGEHLCARTERERQYAVRNGGPPVTDADIEVLGLADVTHGKGTESG